MKHYVISGGSHPKRVDPFAALKSDVTAMKAFGSSVKFRLFIDLFNKQIRLLRVP
jgi:hypothetical protein